jgi:hypothetical protein
MLFSAALRHCQSGSTVTPSSINGGGSVSTSVEHLQKRLRDLERYDLLEAIAQGRVSTYHAAELAGLVRRRPVAGTGSPNAAKRRAFAARSLR